MQITLRNLDFIYANSKVRVRLDAIEPNKQWGGALHIEVVVDHADSVDVMKASAVAAAKDFISRVAAEITVESVVIGPQPQPVS
jgi:hypothetical protein